MKNEDSVEEAAESLLTNNGKLTLLEVMVCVAERDYV